LFFHTSVIFLVYLSQTDFNNCGISDLYLLLSVIKIIHTYYIWFQIRYLFHVIHILSHIRFLIFTQAHNQNNH